jgi:hypothetical protein
VKSDETLNLEITIRNLSQEPFYLCGTINTTRLEPYGNYDLPVKLFGSDSYQTTTKISADQMARAYGKPPLVAEFKAEKNLALLLPNQFIGRRLSGTWALTAAPAGKYDVRIVYSVSATLPVTLDRPFLTGTIHRM